MKPGELLTSAKFFSSVLDPEALDTLAASAKVRQFARGDKLMREGELGQSLFLIGEGKVHVLVHERGGDQNVATLGPGDIVGEMSLLTGARRSATVRAANKVTAVEIAKDDLSPLLTGSPKLVEKFATMLEQRLGELRQHHSDAARWNSVGLSQAELAARMMAFYSG